MSSLRKPKPPWPFTDLPATSPNGVVDSTPSAFLAMSAIESAVSAARVGAARLDGGDKAGLVGQRDDLAFGDAGILGIAALDGAGHHGELEVGIVLDARIVLHAFRIALQHQHGLADAVGRLGEIDLGAALGIDEHAGGDDVEAAGLEAGNERAEFGQHAIDLRDAHLGEHGLGDFRRLAGQLAVGRGEAERRLVGEADADVAVRLGALERRLRLGRQRR